MLATARHVSTSHLRLRRIVDRHWMVCCGWRVCVCVFLQTRICVVSARVCCCERATSSLPNLDCTNTYTHARTHTGSRLKISWCRCRRLAWALLQKFVAKVMWTQICNDNTFGKTDCIYFVTGDALPMCQRTAVLVAGGWPNSLLARALCVMKGESGGNRFAMGPVRAQVNEFFLKILEWMFTCFSSRPRILALSTSA